MKVNGEAFKKAREEILKDSGEYRQTLRGQPAKGTQEWLALIAKIKSYEGGEKPLSVRTIQYLEKGDASIQTIDAVSPYLKINGRELIINYGVNQVNCKAIGAVDFRPICSPKEDLKHFQNNPFVFTVDPLQISFSEGDLDTIYLKSITATLKIDELELDFSWLYEVVLNPTSRDWLGIQREVLPRQISSPENIVFPIMFSQLDAPYISWIELITYVDSMKSKLINIIVNFHFNNFEKKIKIGISSTEMGTFLELGRQSREGSCPSFVQPSALMWK